MVALTQKKGQRFNLNDSLVWYIEQLHVDNDPLNPLDGCRIVYFTGRQFFVTENLTYIQNNTWTSRWIRVTRLDNGFEYLCFRDLVADITPLNGAPANSQITWSLSSASPWTVAESIDTIATPPVIAGTGVAENIQTSIVVAQNGNDTDAVTQAIVVGPATVYNDHFPFANPTVAVAAAAVGDRVVVHPGTYIIGPGGLADDGAQFIAKAGVHVHLMEGAIIHYTTTTGTIGVDVSLPFSDAGGAGEFRITGKGVIKHDLNTSGGVDLTCTTNPASIVDIECEQIDVRRRWGGSTVDFASWRMITKSYINRESQLFLFDFSSLVGGANKTIIWKSEQTDILEEGATDTWIRAQLRNIGDGSYVVIDPGKTTYTKAAAFQSFISIVETSELSHIDVNVNAINRTDTSSTIADYLITRINDRSKGTIDFKGITTITGLFSMAFGGVVNSKKTMNFQGQVRNGGVPGPSSQFLGNMASIDQNIDVNLQIECKQLDADYNGINIQDAPNCKLSGHLRWDSADEVPIRLNAASGVTAQLTNLIISMASGVPASIDNFNATIAQLKIFPGVVATNATGGGGGGINPLISTVLVDPNV